MTSPSEDRLRRAVDELLTVCWNEDISLLEALGEALDDWMALSAVEFGGPAPADSAPGSGPVLEALRGIERVVRCRPGLSVECATADAVSGWVAGIREWGTGEG